jgi:PAS domain S-box-containing protein
MNDFEFQRVRALYDNTLSSLASIAVGVALVAVVFAPLTSTALLKPWVVFMLSAIAMRACLWFMFRTEVTGFSDGPRIVNSRRWEFGYAFCMLLTGAGWGALSGPLYPASTNGQVFLLALTMVTAFSGAIYTALSRISFAMFVLPFVIPGLARFIMTLNENDQALGFVAAAVGCVVLINVHQSLWRFANRQLRHDVETQALLEQQEVIFQTVAAGIAIVRDGKTIKCNIRLGEILGRSLKDIQSIRLTDLLTNTTDVDAFMTATVAALKDNTPCYSLQRMRRADGSVFWAELSGRRMSNNGNDMIWLINDIGQKNRRSSDASN